MSIWGNYQKADLALFHYELFPPLPANDDVFYFDNPVTGYSCQLLRAAWVTFLKKWISAHIEIHFHFQTSASRGLRWTESTQRIERIQPEWSFVNTMDYKYQRTLKHWCQMPTLNGLPSCLRSRHQSTDVGTSEGCKVGTLKVLKNFKYQLYNSFLYNGYASR